MPLVKSNTHWTVGGTGSQVTWAATAVGGKQDATFSPGTTGTGGRMLTTVQGSSDIVAHTKDSLGVQKKRRVLANTATTTVPNIETCVSGAGTKEAIVSVWGSFGTDPKKLLWRVAGVDLSQHQAGYIAYGVTREFA